MVSRTNKFRGRCRTHGRGKKAGRGAGKRGGRGMAGLNKHRAMTRIIEMPNHYGRHGFNRHPTLYKHSNCINVGEISNLATDGKIDLTSLGYDKLLGGGKVNEALEIVIEEASERAVAKVEAAGGTIQQDDEFEGDGFE